MTPGEAAPPKARRSAGSGGRGAVPVVPPPGEANAKGSTEVVSAHAARAAAGAVLPRPSKSIAPSTSIVMTPTIGAAMIAACRHARRRAGRRIRRSAARSLGCSAIVMATPFTRDGIAAHERI